MTHRIFAVDETAYIAARTPEEALAAYRSYTGPGEGTPEIAEHALDDTLIFEQPDGTRREMSFRAFLGESYEYAGPQLVCWAE